MKIRIFLLALFMTVGFVRVNTQPVNCQFGDGECGCYMWPEGNTYECFGSPYGSSSLGKCKCAPPWET